MGDESFFPYASIRTNHIRHRTRTTDTDPNGYRDFFVENLVKKISNLYDKSVNIYESFSHAQKAIDEAQIKMRQSKDRLRDGKDSFTKQLDNIKKEGRLTTKKNLPPEAIDK